MKQVIKFGIILDILCRTLCVNAQTSYVVTASLHIPIKIYHDTGRLYSGGIVKDTSLTKNYSNVLADKGSTSELINFGSDSWQGSVHTNENFNISIDSNDKKLNLLYTYSQSYSFRQDRIWDQIYVDLRSIPYRQIDKNKIEISAQNFYNYIDSIAYYFYQYFEGFNYYGGDLFDTLISVTSDSVPMIFSLTISPVLSVPVSNNNLKFNILSSPQNIFIYFPFSNHYEILHIYDLLGREISRIEIPPGATQYTFNTSGFPAGHYFARLGNMTGHFVVY